MLNWLVDQSIKRKTTNVLMYPTLFEEFKGSLSFEPKFILILGGSRMKQSVSVGLFPHFRAQHNNDKYDEVKKAI